MGDTVPDPSTLVNDPELLEATGCDVRYVAVTVRDIEPPAISFGGCSEYEAIGLLRAAVKRMEDSWSAEILLPGEELEESEDDED